MCAVLVSPDEEVTASTEMTIPTAPSTSSSNSIATTASSLSTQNLSTSKVIQPSTTSKVTQFSEIPTSTKILELLTTSKLAELSTSSKLPTTSKLPTSSELPTTLSITPHSSTFNVTRPLQSSSSGPNSPTTSQTSLAMNSSAAAHQTQAPDEVNAADMTGNVGEVVDRQVGGVSGVVMGGAVVGLLLLLILMSVVGVVPAVVWLKHKRKHAAIGNESPREFCNAIYGEEGK